MKSKSELKRITEQTRQGEHEQLPDQAVSLTQEYLDELRRQVRQEERAKYLDIIKTRFQFAQSKYKSGGDNCYDWYARALELLELEQLIKETGDGN